MAGISEDEQIDFLFKKFTNTVNANPVLPFSNTQNRRFPFQNFEFSKNLFIDDIPENLDNITYNGLLGSAALDASFGVATDISYEIPNYPLLYYHRIELTNALDGLNNTSWYYPDPNNNKLSLLRGSIPFNYDPINFTYKQMLYSNSNQEEALNSDPLYWLFDYKSGFVQFYGDPAAVTNWVNTHGPPRISVIVYNGNKGLENFSGGDGITTSGDLNDTSIILGILEQYFPINTDINGNTLIQEIDNFNITGNLSVSDDANIDGNLIVDGFFGGNYYGPMGSIRTIPFSSIPGINENYYYLGEFTSHLPSHIYILGSGSGSVYTITRHNGSTPHISGILGDSYYIYRFFYQAVNFNNSYHLWFRPYINYGGYQIDVTVKIQSFSYNYLSEPTNSAPIECKYGLIQQNEESTTYIGIGTHDPNSSTSTAVSDDRLKFNETTITNGLSVINKLNPVIYDMSPEFNNEVRTRKRSGFVAQEVYEIDDLKHTINVGNDSNPWSIHYNDIFTYNIAATKELDTIVQQQKNEIDSLKDKNLELENKVDLLKNKLNELLSESGKEIITF